MSLAFPSPFEADPKRRRRCALPAHSTTGRDFVALDASGREGRQRLHSSQRALLLASIHAVLNKRDSRAVALWLGFFWLLPFVVL